MWWKFELGHTDGTIGSCSKQSSGKDMIKLPSAGSYGIHSMHWAFNTVENKTGWGVEKLLKGWHRIFQQFPLPFCHNNGLKMKRWQLELLIFGKTYVNYATCVSHCQKANSHLNAFKVHLILAELHFFTYMAGTIKPLLLPYQSTKSMIPFL